MMMRLRALFPRTVIVPWIVSRVLVIFTLMVLGARTAADRPDYSRLVTWDGNWYRIIATVGYGVPPVPGNWSTWPFFPLFPAIGWLAHRVGSPYTAALLVCSNLAALVALAGVRRMTRETRAANWAVWLVALFPGSLTMVMAYPDSLYLAGVVWAFIFVRRSQPARAGIAALVATSARPNGLLILLPLALELLGNGPARQRLARMGAALGPSLAFLVCWCGWLWHATGNPLVFLDAKAGWKESSLWNVVTSPIVHRYALLHVVVAAVLATPFLLRWRRYPMSWRVLVAVSLLPSLVLGTVGLARYSICCFPLAVAAGERAGGDTATVEPSARLALERTPRWPLVVSAGLLVWFGLLVTFWNYVP